MKKIISFILAVTMLAGCGSGSTPASAQPASAASETKTTSSADTLSGSVSTDGSTSMEKVIGYLMESFMNEHPGVTVSYNPTGSASGITAAKEGTADFGLASRDLKEDEKDGLVQTTIAIDGIAIIVNPENSVSDLSIDQIAKIYTGEITNWKDVGGSDGTIVNIGREAGSGTRDGFETITDTKDKCQLSQELTSTGDVIQTVSGNPNAIGYASVAALNDTVKAVTVEGVAPTEETIKDGTYKIQRNFNVITGADQTLSSAAQAFFDYMKSPEAAELITKAGAVPVN